MSTPTDTEYAKGMKQAKSSLWERFYVPRAQYHDRFQELVDRGANRIALVGLAGMGKTWLARKLARTQDGSEAARIRFFGGKALSSDLHAALLANHIDTSNVIDSASHDYLTLLLCSDQAPRFVVLDNLESAAELTHLLPANLTSTVVVTCRRRGETPPDAWEFIHVGKMATQEAAELVKKYLPHISDDTATLLASELEGYPLVLRYACILLEHQSISPKELCADLRAHGRVVAEHIHTEEGSALTAVLARVVKLIKEQNIFAYAVLECIASHGPWYTISQSFLAKYLGKVIEDVTGTTVATSWYYAHAVRTLHNFSLIDFSDNDPTHVNVHPMVQRILVEVLNLFPDRLAEVAKTTLGLWRDFLNQWEIIPPDSAEQGREEVQQEIQERLARVDREVIIDWDDVLWSSYAIFDVVARMAYINARFAQAYPDISEECGQMVALLTPILEDTAHMLELLLREART